MSNNKKSFLLHIDSLDILDDLNDQQSGMLFKAMKAYQKGEDIELDGIVKIAFSPFKNQFIRDDEKYKKTCERRAEAGRKGGEAKQANASKDKQVLASSSNCKQDIANLAENKNKNKTNSDSDSDSDSDSKDTSKPSSAKANEAFDIFCYWKSVMKKNDSTKLTPKRLKAINARLKETYTVDEIKQAIYGCSVTPHNMGKNDNQTVYDCLELICRTGENIERFAGNAQKAAPQQYSAVTERNINNIRDLDLN